MLSQELSGALPASAGAPRGAACAPTGASIAVASPGDALHDGQQRGLAAVIAIRRANS